MSMNARQKQSLLTITLLAAFADGAKSEAERTEVKRIAESLSTEDVNLAALYQDVLLKRVTLDQATAGLDTAENRQLAYEFAVCVADADGAENEAEKAFLAQLRDKLGLDAGAAAAFTASAESVASAPLDRPTAVEPQFASTMAPTEMDAMILNYAILNGALELLPETLASMAIIPLQMKMVFRVGKAHGFELDRGHVKDFLATLGVGLTSQYVERVGARLVGKLFGRIGGGLLGGLGRQAVSSGMSFASTYALGHMAKRYYAGGRTLSGEALKAAFSDVLADAKGLQSRYVGEIREKARTLDAGKVLAEIGK
jgi:uncharacterized protein (DUF697 family)/tellurite resistance protein